jgi:hypothetical protein
MSRSNHFDHDAHMKNVSPNLKWINGLFNEIQFLVTSYNADKEKDCKIVLSWLVKVHEHFSDPEFNTLTIARFLDDLSRITSNHPVLKTCIIKYMKDHHNFREDLFEKTYDLLLDSKPRELCHILGGLSSLELALPVEWWSRWFSISTGKMSSFNARDIRQSIRACARFHKKPPQEWCDSWSLQCSVQINEFFKEEDTFSKILSAVGHLKIRIDPTLLKELIDNARIFLTSLTKSEELFFVSKAFAIEEVCKEKRLVSDWFKHSYNKINDLNKREVEALCIAFFYVGKLDENVSSEWIERCVEKITGDFEHLSVKAITNALYAMALFQMEVKQVRPFLEKCMLLFKMERNKIGSYAKRVGRI